MSKYDENKTRELEASRSLLPPTSLKLPMPAMKPPKDAPQPSNNNASEAIKNSN